MAATSCTRPQRKACLVAALIAITLPTPTALLGQPNPVPEDPAAEFVQLTAEIEMLSWGAMGGPEGPRWESIPIHAVVGRNKWVLGDEFGTTNQYTFDGTQLVEQTWFGSGLSPRDLNGQASPGQWWTRGSESTDGNPSRTIRVVDHLDIAARIAWLAFGSSPALNNPSHKLYPPWDFWKEYLNPSTFVEKVTRFEDDLGLPKTLLLFSGENQPVVDYRVSGVTNVAGWLFPKSFLLLEYNPTGTKGWMLILMAHGKLTSIAPAADPFATGETKIPHHAWRFTPVPPSRVHLEGTTDVVDWSLDSTHIVGFLELNQPLLDPSNLQTRFFQPDNLHARAEFFLPVRHFRGSSTSSFSDKPDQAVLHHALKTTDHPNIIYRLQQLTLTKPPQSDAAALILQSKGELVIGGVTNSVSFPIQIARQTDGLRVSGTTAIKLSDYGILPSAVEGKDWSSKIGDTVESSFDLQLKKVE